MQNYKIIINKSKVPVGIADIMIATVSATLKSLNKDLTFDVVSNPEFLNYEHDLNNSQ
jgi:UDPglucose 6-dehydrogenase